MSRTRQHSYAIDITWLLSLLVLTVTVLSATSLSEAACIRRTVNLKSEIWTEDLRNQTLVNTTMLTTEIVKVLPSGNQNCTPNVISYSNATVPDFPGVIADVFINKENAESFEEQLLAGIPYHNSILNKTYNITAASRVFVVSFNVAHPSITDNNVTDAVKTVLGIQNGTVAVLKNESGYYELRIWMKMTADEFPSNALKALADAVGTGSVEGISVNSSSFMAFSRYPEPAMTKKFEVKFDYTADCTSAVSNKSSIEHQELSKNISAFLTMTLNASEYLRSSITKLQCSSSNSRSARASSSTVKVAALVEYSQPQDPSSIGRALQDCSSLNPQVSNVQVRLLNPSSLGESQGAMSVICPTSASTVSIPATSRKPDTGTLPSTTQPPVMGKTPRLFARLRLALTWSQFCSKLEESLKESIARNVQDKQGNRVSSDRVVFINGRKNCANPSKADEQVDLWFYIANRTGSETPSKCVTLKAYRVLKMMVDNGNTNLLGSDFKGKVVGLNLAGCDAKQFDSKDKMDDWILMLIIIALIVGAILLFLACCCICCGAARRRRRRRHRDKYDNVEMVIVDADGNPQADGEGGKRRKQAKKQQHRGGYYNGGRGYGYSDSDDSDDYLCFGGRAGRGRGRGGYYDADDSGRRGKHHGGDGHRDGDLNGIDGAGKSGTRYGRGRKSGGGGGGGGGDYDSDDSDVDQLCGGRRRKRPRKYKERKNKDHSGDGAGDGKGDSKGNNNLDVSKDAKGKNNAGYDDVHSDNNKVASQPISYQNLQYGLGDRKPSADGGYTSLKRNGQDDNSYATVDDVAKRQSRGGSVGSYGYVTMEGGGANTGKANAGGAGTGGAGTGGAGTGGAGTGGAGTGGAGTGGAGVGGAGTGGAETGGAAVAGAAGLLARSTADGNKRESLTPAIVTSPAPDSGPQTNVGVSGSPGPRRGSGSRGGSPTGSRTSSGTAFGNVDDELQRERRRSSIHSLLDDDAEPLKHKTATVGIVGLALRNKNERKKETEFKNLDKEMPALGTYPANTAGKNRNPDILPNPRSRVKLSSSPDYINASYLHDHKGQRHYIATQHPLVETKADFWQMVWEKESHLIVMVNDDENSKQMDYPQYWPAAEGGSVDFNGIVVSSKQVVTKADYVITTLVVTNTKTKPSTTREISHYRYTSWKEKDVPNIAMFVGFVVATREVGRKYEDGKSPVVVHCSNGQGFTGVFIALDIGIRSHEENKTSVVDLFELAKRLRQGRNGIIDSLQLYNYTYQCLYEYTVNYDEEAEKKK